MRIKSNKIKVKKHRNLFIDKLLPFDIIEEVKYTNQRKGGFIWQEKLHKKNKKK